MWLSGENEMKLDSRLNKKRAIILCAFLVTAVLALQLVAMTAWTANDANSGPGVIILQLSDDEDTDWAVADLQRRLSEFINDDPFFVDRVTVRKTNDPYVAKTLDGQIVVYMSHGGPRGIVTGNRITSWYTMARIITESKAKMHLFAACYSRNILCMGSEDSGKKLYTVPQARPAEVTNVELTAIIMSALGLNADVTEEYRTSELKNAKKLIDAGSNVHMMDFEQIVMSEVDYIDEHYSDTYTTYFQVVNDAESSTLSGSAGFALLPTYLHDMILQYYASAWDNSGGLFYRTLIGCDITYVKNFYYERWWVEDPEPPPEDPDPPPVPPPNPRDPIPSPDSYLSPIYVQAEAMTGGHWECGPYTYTGGVYSGVVKFEGYTTPFQQITVNVSACGPAIDANGKAIVDSIDLTQDEEGGVYVQQQKIDGVWEKPIIGRIATRTGGTWAEPTIKADYEYDGNWPAFPETITAGGTIGSTGEYITITGIPTGSGWHGPSFVQTLPSYFKLKDFEAISANLSLVHNSVTAPLSLTAVALYDSNKKLAVALYVVDYWSGTAGSTFIARFYEENGNNNFTQSSTLSGDVSGICKIYYDPIRGIYGEVPGKAQQQLYKPNLVNEDRLIKYVAIQSYRYGSETEHDERIYGVWLSYSGSDYTVFHDNCNDMDEFHIDPDFGYGSVTDGTIEVQTGQSYMKLTSVESGSGWHGPNYVHILDRPFRLYQLVEFSVLTGLNQGTASLMGKMTVGLFDEAKNPIMTVEWADDGNYVDGYLKALFFGQGGTVNSRYLWYGDSSMQTNVRLWWNNPTDGYGGIYVHSDVAPYDYLLGSCYNVSRVVKYVAIAGQGYSSNPLLDMRIHDINVVADPNRQSPAFIDDCISNFYFPLDNSFPWGVTSAGALSAGSSYLYPSGIPSSYTGWHGPNFVHTLSNPFELKDLSEFSVEGEIVQTTNSPMGAMYVALFDENMQIALMVYWVDAWTGSTKGYFHVAYYPLGESAHYDNTDTTYSSIHRTGKLWVHDGNMQYLIPGYDSGNMGPVTDPHRIIKYVVIRAARYNTYTLCNLRVDQIRVIDGLPTEAAPAFSDATPTGTSNTAEREFGPQVETATGQAASAISSYWTLDLWWPLCHIVADIVLASDVSFSIHVTLDLLGCVSLTEFNLELFGLQLMSLQQSQQLINAIDAETVWSRAVQAMIGITAALFMAAQIIAVFLTPAWEWAFWTILGAFVTSFIFTMVLLVWQTRLFNLDPVTKGIYFFFTAILALGTSMLNYAALNQMSGCTGWNSISKYFAKVYYDGNAKQKATGFRGRSHAALAIAEIVCFISVIIIAVGFAANLW